MWNFLLVRNPPVGTCGYDEITDLIPYDQLQDAQTGPFCTSPRVCVYVADYNWKLFFCRRSPAGQHWSDLLSNTWWSLMPRIHVFSGWFCRKTKISVTLITTMPTSISHGSAKGNKKSYCKTIEMDCSRFYNWRAGVRYRQIWTSVHLLWPGPWKWTFL